MTRALLRDLPRRDARDRLVVLARLLRLCAVGPQLAELGRVRRPRLPARVLHDAVAACCVLLFSLGRLVCGPGWWSRAVAAAAAVAALIVAGVCGLFGLGDGLGWFGWFVSFGWFGLFGVFGLFHAGVEAGRQDVGREGPDGSAEEAGLGG